MNHQHTVLPDKAGVIIFPPLLYFIAIAIGVTSSFLFPKPLLPTKLALVIGIALLAVSIGIVQAAVKALLKHRTAVNPNNATTAIVSSGVYRVTRNPMYVAFTLFYTGIMVMTNAWFGFVLLLPLLLIVHYGIIRKEENYLTKKFGDRYSNYRQQVNRWL